MLGFFDRNGRYFCSIECHRRFHGVTADPYRAAAHDQQDGACWTCTPTDED